MASTELREELNCSICLSIFTDPVNLRCGHNFCRGCIDCVLEKQKGSGGYSCPECRTKFKKRPALQRNIALCNVVRHFQSTQPDVTVSGVFCSYCIHAPVPAVKSCLLCEASLCDDHLRVHNKSSEHVLSDPTASPENQKCSIHRKILEYYCTEDSTCICVTCCLLGEHKGHPLESLLEASEKKKMKLKNLLEELISESSDIEKKVQMLQEHHRKEQEKAADLKKRVAAIFKDLKRQVEVRERRALGGISWREDIITRSVLGVTHHLEVKKEALSWKMTHIRELCNMTDAVTVLQDPVLDRDNCQDLENEEYEIPENTDEMISRVGDLKMDWFLKKLQDSLSDLEKNMNIWIFMLDAEDLLLDVNTTANDVLISDDLRTATWSEISQDLPESPERFQKHQVISVQSYSSGRHYWEVETGGASIWRIGVCYPSMNRRDDHSTIGSNNKSWCLSQLFRLAVVHDNEVNKLHFIGLPLPSKRFGIYLDYDVGQLSFYILSEPTQHLHTFTTTFTEPLHVAFYTQADFPFMSPSPLEGSWIKAVNHRNNSASPVLESLKS